MRVYDLLNIPGRPVKSGHPSVFSTVVFGRYFFDNPWQNKNNGDHMVNI